MIWTTGITPQGQARLPSVDELPLAGHGPTASPTSSGRSHLPAVVMAASRSRRKPWLQISKLADDGFYGRETAIGLDAPSAPPPMATASQGQSSVTPMKQSEFYR
ncbi:hypothetical protein NL676_007284 [Syzygium grande]|nr:hypothetical protein NL676_007284 [Syzygium grande]